MKALFQFLRTWLPHLIFWGWNLLFLCVAVFGIVPWLGELVFEATLSGEIPWSFTASFLVLTAIPPASIVVGFFWRRRPDRLIRFFCGVEAPVFLTCLARLILLKQLNPGLAFLGAGFLVMATIYIAHVAGRPVPRRRSWAAAELAGTTLVLAAGLYLAAVLAFYVVPLAGWIVREDFGVGLWRGFLPMAMWTLVWTSAMLTVAIPVALPWFYVEAWRQRFGGYCDVLGKRGAMAASAAVMALIVGAFVAVNRQPQQAVFERLEAGASSVAEKRRILAESERLRRGLLNAYLASYRYVSSVKENTHVRAMFQETFGGKSESYAGLEKIYNVLARPVLYDGPSLRGDQQKASQLYVELFDTPIQKAEKRAIVRAVESTWERGSIEAGLLDRDAEKVRVVGQDVRVVRESARWAEIELYEVYRNETYEQQEVLYSFSLPETAAITGLWLGASEDREHATSTSSPPAERPKRSTGSR